MDLPSSESSLGLASGDSGLDLGEFGTDLPELNDDLPLIESGSASSIGGVTDLTENSQAGFSANSDELLEFSEQEIELPSFDSPLESSSDRGINAEDSINAREPKLPSFAEIADEFDNIEPDSRELPNLFPDADHGSNSAVAVAAPPAPPRPAAAHSQSMEDTFGEGSLDALTSEVSPQSFGELSFGDDASVEEFDAFPTEAGPNSKAELSSAEYGDINLGDTDGALDLGADVEHPQSTATNPAGAPPAAFAAVERPGSPSQSKVVKTKRGLSRQLKVTMASAFFVAAAGGALTFEPKIGAFGSHFIIDWVKEADHQDALIQDRKRSQARLDTDMAMEVEGAFRDVLRRQMDAPRFGPRKAYAAFLGYWRDLRFGGDTNLGARAKVLIDELKAEEATGELFFDLALAAQDLAEGKVDKITKRSKSLISKGPEYAAVVGESALEANLPTLALTAFNALTNFNGVETPLGLFGKARAKALLLETDKAIDICEKVLSLNSAHVGAMLLIAELELENPSQDEELVEKLSPLTQELSRTSSGQRVRALGLLGQLHLNRGRIKAAEEAFSLALGIDRGNTIAQRGLAESLFASGLYSEALAHFESALKREPNNLRVHLGVVESKLMLESLEDATKELEALRALYKDSTSVAYFSGQVAEKLDQRPEAKVFYESAIEYGQDLPELVMAYVALTRLIAQQGEGEAAALLIREAREKFPKNPLIYNQLADLSRERGAFEMAIEQYGQALEIDPRNLAFQFSLAIALRQAGRFEEAQATFDSIGVVSKDYPGLALERGNLYEASGRSEEALKSYEAALAVAPDDLDMMLRVGCGRALAGQALGTVDLLKKVIEARPDSAEVNFCLGVSLLSSLQNNQMARRHLQRAVDYDPTRAQHHYYLGVALVQTGASSEALESFDKALELDRTMADAFWQRGDFKVKLGQVVDAVEDLKKALSLSPERREAHASLALAYMGMGKEQDAITQWGKAMLAQKVQPEWFYFYGKLLVDNGRMSEASKPLKKGIELVPLDAEKSNPWIYDAHRYYAMTIGKRKAAIPHWNKFLSNRPDSPYAPEGIVILKQLSR